MTDDPTHDIPPAPRYAWRCGGCAIRPLLAVYSVVGTVHISISGRRKVPMNYLVDLTGGSLLAQCPAPNCQQWRELYYDGSTGEVRERHYTGPVGSTEDSGPATTGRAPSLAG